MRSVDCSGDAMRCTLKYYVRISDSVLVTKPTTSVGRAYDTVDNIFYKIYNLSGSGL